MASVDEVRRMLKLAVERLGRAKPELGDINVIQAARADLEKVLAGFEGQSTVYVANSASVLRAVAKALESIDNAEVRGAWADVVEAAIMTEGSNRQGLS
jgi:hypothetical protein